MLDERGKGTEGWIPLWAKMATKEQAEKVKDNMTDPGKFDTFVPLPTASKDNPKYNPDKYWRGPVWMDQALYGIEALQNYGFDKDAERMAKKLFNNAEGLMGDGPIINQMIIIMVETTQEMKISQEIIIIVEIIQKIINLEMIIILK